MADSAVRLKAVRVLSSLVRDGKSLGETLPVAQEQMEKRDAAFLQELVFGVCRHYGELDDIVNQLLKKPLKTKDTDVRVLLWLALYELRYIDSPDYAVTNSYVDLTRKIKKVWTKALVNGSMRAYLRDADKYNDAARAASPYSLPAWITEAVQIDWPEQADEMLNAFNSRAPLTLRVNTSVTDRSSVLEKLKARDIEASACEWVASGIRLHQSHVVTKLPGFKAGEISVQDQAAQLAGYLLAPAVNERVLDACAAPGGKSCHLLELEPSIKLDCLDSSEDRLARLQQNLDRLKVSANIICSDAANVDAWWDGEPYDAILLDAPCSALGAMRRHPDIRLLRRESDIEALADQQFALLSALWRTLKPGGRLLYATCSVLKQENEKCVEKFLTDTSDATVAPIGSAAPPGIESNWGIEAFSDRPQGQPIDQPIGQQILTGQSDADGFFYSKLLKGS